MSDRPFLDTNVLVYTVALDARRTPVADALVAEGGVVSVQVLNEFAAVAHRKLGMSWTDIGLALGAIRSLCPTVVPVTIAIHNEALRLAARYRFSIYDSLIVAAALDARCSVLYSEDLKADQMLERRLTVRNPF